MRRALALTLLTAIACATTPAAPPAASPAPPIAWQRWTKATFERARQERRIIVVAIQTQWCHWCHVMDEETWSDDDIKRLVGDRYLAIREDADARPDLGERYADWGWPALALLTPDAEPIAELRGFQRKGPFLELLRDLAAKLDRGERIGRVAVADGGGAAGEPSQLEEMRALTQQQLDTYWDDKEGGWGTQKYPFWAPIEHAIMRGFVAGDGLARYRGMLTLDMARSLIDPVDGGMFQYSVDGVWTAPHYEKLAEINGAMLGSYARGYLANRHEQMEAAGRALHAYLTSTLRDPATGAFYANQDADVGTRGERPRVLGKQYYASDKAARAQAGAPFVDKNVYALHNGRVIAGMARFGAAVDDAGIVADAARAGDAVFATHVDAEGRVAHAPGDRVVHLADQAALAMAFVELYEATLDDKWRAQAQALSAALVGALWDEQAGAFRAHTVDDDTPAAVAVRTPLKGNAEAARLLLKVGRLEENEAHVAIARRTLQTFARPALIADEGRVVGEYLLALEEALAEPLHFAVVAKSVDEGRALQRASLRVNAPHRVIELVAPGGKYPDIGEPALYICGKGWCSPPITDPALVEKKAALFARPRS